MLLMKNTDFMPFPSLSKGKVRDIYDLGEHLLLITTDRISAFDVVFNELIPDKGQVLNRISAFWFELLSPICPHHMISTNIQEYPTELRPFAAELDGRSMLVKKLVMQGAECIVRGYLEGSALKEYRATQTVASIPMPSGLRQGDPLPEPLFTPSTKAAEGHDINISFAQLQNLLGAEMAGQLKDKSLALYKAAADYALKRGIILADSKFEFGVEEADGDLLIADELFTPDSSRFWAAADYEAGRAQKSFDKQYLREYLETLDWDKQYPAPALPDEVVRKTAEKYAECYQMISGKTLG